MKLPNRPKLNPIALKRRKETLRRRPDRKRRPKSKSWMPLWAGSTNLMEPLRAGKEMTISPGTKDS